MDEDCPNCGANSWITNQAAGDIVCTACGYVGAARIIDETGEWRAYTDKANAVDGNRVGGPSNPLLDNGGLAATSIAKSDGRAAGFANLERYHQQNSSINRALLEGFKTISDMAERLSLGKQFMDRAQEVFKKTHEGKTLKGRSSEAACAACLYIACRLEQRPRTFQEICAVTRNADKFAVGKAYKAIYKKLQSDLDESGAGAGPGMQKQVGLLSPKDYIRRFCSQLQYPNDVVQSCTAVADAVQKHGVSSSRNPHSVAAAIIFFLGQMSSSPRSLDEVSAVSGVAGATIKLIASDELAAAQSKLVSDAVLAKLK